MQSIHNILPDDKGNKVSVVLPLKEFQKLMEELEELEDIRLYDDAKQLNEPPVAIDEAFKMIESNRSGK